MVDVLVVGAGPTGLALAAQVRAHGGSVRIVERRLDRRRDSPALIVQPRTLEVLEPLGLTAKLIERGNSAAIVHLHRGPRVVSISLSSHSVKDTSYPFLLAIPQREVEAVLEANLGDAGVRVERGTELIGFTQQRDGGVGCTLRTGDGGREIARSAYLVGCDGAESLVRRNAGIAFPGSMYSTTILLADLRLKTDLSRSGVHAFLGPSGVLFLFPIGDANWRLLIPSSRPGRRRKATTADWAHAQDLTAAIEANGIGAFKIEEVGWTTEIHLRRGLAARYRSGRVFLAGDAAHVHSPAGAQGMNTGIQDAVNLGWKLAITAQGIACDPLLDTYEQERRAIAHWTRRLTDAAFVIETSDHLVPRLLRDRAASYLLPLMARHAPTGMLLRIMGGLSTRYRRRSGVLEDRAPFRRGLRPGERLPNGLVARDGRTDWLHRYLTPPGFHLLLCGPSAEWDAGQVRRLCDRYSARVSVHRLTLDRAPGVLHDIHRHTLARLCATGATQYLVRPDGYVGFRQRGVCVGPLMEYLDRCLPGLNGVRHDDAAIRPDLTTI
jgi:2-polyprenyl-6-methoxyphenol hydroxylase-like FAD-dependent oxidoreductase